VAYHGVMPQGAGRHSLPLLERCFSPSCCPSQAQGTRQQVDALNHAGGGGF
jgi:hypothetical protein